MSRTDLQAQGEQELRERLLADADVRRATDKVLEVADQLGARRHLLATSTRLTVEMAPELHQIVDGCRATLGVDGPLELFVYPDATFNAAAVRPERGRLLMMVSSSLLEAFSDDELRFVIGHEVGHYLFEHHSIPVGLLLGGHGRVRAEIALALFAWQRYAEISADRAGLVCAGRLEPVASGLFKLASGLRGDRIKVRIDEFMAQVGDLRAEDAAPDASDVPRRDWFATHPFSPLRLKAAQLCARSELVQKGGMPRAELEAAVEDLMTIMEASYLRARTPVAETMRRLLFAGGVAIAATGGEVTEEAIQALEKLLGPGSIPVRLKPEVILADLDARIAAVRATVPPLRRAQVLRDLCVVARADGTLDEAEMKIIRQIAAGIDVDESLIACAIDPSASECGPCGTRT